MCVRVCVYVREYIQLTHPAQKEFDIAELPRRKGGDYDGTCSALALQDMWM